MRQFRPAEPYFTIRQLRQAAVARHSYPAPFRRIRTDRPRLLRPGREPLPR